ncbi:MAG TPA: hypothetical protein VLA91_11395, partial [Acidimicrobiia bacterium]|nr:hypothetical protein [Acidimicrobiia bacterium]
YRWLKEEMGLPIEQTEAAVVSLLNASDFAARHPGASHHLREAFALLWSDRTDDQTISEIGDHLRKSLMDITADLPSDNSGGVERPIDRLEAIAQSKEKNLGSREMKVLGSLVQLAADVLSLDHRLNHIRDETDKGLPLRTWDEMRRAAFVTALACYELDLALAGR